MGETDDDLFRYLEKEIRGDRAKATVEELRAIFSKYMTELGPNSSEQKLEAVLDGQPELDPTMAAALAHMYVVADGIMVAVALQLARSKS